MEIFLFIYLVKPSGLGCTSPAFGGKMDKRQMCKFTTPAAPGGLNSGVETQLQIY